MGALHRLVDLLQKLDENNDKWRDMQRRRAVAETENAFNSGDRESREIRLKEINETFEFNSSDYGRKLYLIENSIYGVDIQPIATQIAKLRFFISLVVDQRVEPNTPNLGVRPLPNLETRLVAADTLIPIEKAKSDLFSSEIDRLRSELATIRHEHFNARSPTTKRKWREADAAKRQEIADYLDREHAMPRDSAQKLAAWDPYDQNTVAPFFDSEWMFGLPVGKVRLQGTASATLRGNLALVNHTSGQMEIVSSEVKEIDSGFDVVIGNPPYIRIQTLKKKDPTLAAFYKDHYASAAKGNYDIYVVFVDAAMQLLKPDGHLAFICPHKFFNAKYGEPLRQLITAGNHLRHIVHFGDQQVFPGATIYTCLLFLAKAGSAECRVVMAHDLEAWMTTGAGVEGRFPTHAVGPGEWNFAVGVGAGVLERLKQVAETLGSIADLFVGVQTDADDVFILEAVSERRDAVICYSKHLDANVEIERNHLKPLVKGSLNIRRFHFADVTKRLLFPYEMVRGRSSLISPAEYRRRFPMAWKYLEKCRKRLEDRAGGEFKDFWHGYVYKKNHTRLDQPKLLVPAIGQEACFAADLEGTFYFVGSGGGGGGGCAIVVNADASHSLRSLEAVLNSSLSTYFLRHVSSSFRGGYFAMNRQVIEKIPIVPPTIHQAGHLAKVSELLSTCVYDVAAHPSTQMTRDPLMLAYWERVLNGLVYELYFPEEVQGAGLRLFGLVEKACLPDVSALPADERLPLMRDLFETLHDGDHPLRIALDKLQSLDTVRIIEGKA